MRIRTFAACLSACGIAGAVAQSSPEWRPLPQSLVPVAATWDSARQVTVLITQDHGLRQWTWDGQQLRERLQALAGIDQLWFLGDDQRRGELVALQSNPLRAGRFDGARWNWTTPATPLLLTPASRPALDAWRGRVVVVQQGALGLDVLEFDGSSWWSTPGSANGPSSRRSAAFAYDPSGRRCVLYGGDGLADCWSWDGSTWTLLSAQAPPGVRAGAAMTAAGNGALLLYGGSSATTTWTLAGTGWAQLPTAQNPGPRAFATLCRDPQGLLLLGGSATDMGAWRYSGTAWQPLPISFSRPEGAGVAYDPVRGEGVFFGANGSSSTWLFGDRWRLGTPTVAPPPRVSGGLCWSAVDQGVLLFGGLDGPSTPVGDTWLWNGTDWRQRSPVHAPSPRFLPMIVQDPTGGVLLYGGASAVALEQDQWRWDGADWVAMAPIVPPFGWIPSTPGAVGYDAARNRVVLTGPSVPSATCEWDGVRWRTANATPLPMASVVRLGFDPRLGAVVTMTNPMFRWDGVSWTGLAPAPSPAPPAAALLFTDTARGRLLAVDRGSVAVATARPARVDEQGTGCALGASPGLAALGDPVPGSLDFAAEVATLTPSVPTALGLGFGVAATPLGAGCRTWIAQPLVTLLATADAFARAEFSLPIPNTSSLRGLTFVTQAAVWDPPRSLLGSFTLTGALQIAIGD